MVRHMQAAVGAGGHRFGEEEVAPGHRPAGRVVRELQVGATADASGYLSVPDRPGLGALIDEDAVRRWAVS